VKRGSDRNESSDGSTFIQGIVVSSGQILAVNRVLDVRLVHLVPALLGPEDFLLGRAIVFVPERVVVVAGRDDLAAGGNRDRLLEIVEQLPVEIVPGNAEHRLLATVGIHDHVAHVLPAQMHVRRQRVGRHRLGDWRLGWETRIAAREHRLDLRTRRCATWSESSSTISCSSTKSR